MQTQAPPPQRNVSRLESIALLPKAERERFFSELTEREAEEIESDWRWNARPAQLIPGTPGAQHKRADWLFWLVLAGRGFGKTRTGAETIREWSRNSARLALIAPTWADMNEVMIDGESGLMSVFPRSERPIYNQAKHTITFASGCIGTTRSAEEPERLRGLQFSKFWWDELCACTYAKEAYEQLMFGFRKKGAALQGLFTTTPKPIPLLKAIKADPDTVLTTGSSYDNRANLASAYYDRVIRPYEGTRLGRQEINAEILEDVEGALWTRQGIEATRVPLVDVKWGMVVRIVVAIDPAVTSNEASDETGIIVAALTRSGHVLILSDLSGKLSALDWGKVAIAAYWSRRADRIVAEVNNGGDLVERNIRAIDDRVAYKAVRASRGKMIRAEPVASLYERGMVHHVGTFPALEDQMVGWTPKSADASPDRLDAMVWAVTELALEEREGANVQQQFARPYTISSV